MIFKIVPTPGFALVVAKLIELTTLQQKWQSQLTNLN